jgi:DNA adenine methylase
MPVRADYFRRGETRSAGRRPPAAAPGPPVSFPTNAGSSMSAFTYYGGKTWYAKDIAAVIERECEGRRVDRYIEPFCGWCAVAAQLRANGRLRPREFVASDYNKSVVLLWQGLTRGTWAVPARVLSRAEWQRLRAGPASALKAFAGIVYSFNGRYFSSYRPPMRADSRRLHDRAALLKGVRFACRKFDCEDYLAARGCAFYLDPPYKSRVMEYVQDGAGDGAGVAKPPPFDHAHFWDVARKLAKHNVVVVSEYSAPRDWRCVAVLPKRGQQKTQNVNCVSPHPEKLFVLGPAAGPAAAAPGSRKQGAVQGGAHAKQPVKRDAQGAGRKRRPAQAQARAQPRQAPRQR